MDNTEAADEGADREPLRVVFMGTPAFAIPSLEAILDAGYNVPLVVTAPDRPKGRGLQTIPSEIKSYALGEGLDVFAPQSLREEETVETIRAAAPDVIVVVAFRILPESIYTIPPLGSFNLHASLLPRYRGAAPINWAIINGDVETGVTSFFLKKQVDTGGVILQRPVPIGPEMSAGELHDVLMRVGAEVVVETLKRIEQGVAIPVEQNDAGATPAPKIFRDDCRIDWTLPGESIRNFIRGLSPRPGAWTILRGKVFKILRARFTGDAGEGLAPGEIVTREGGIIVGVDGGMLELLEVQQEGKRPMSGGEFTRGFAFVEGESFG
jgi:methionyl-tRNA formyltransferase